MRDMSQKLCNNEKEYLERCRLIREEEWTKISLLEGEKAEGTGNRDEVYRQQTSTVGFYILDFKSYLTIMVHCIYSKARLYLLESSIQSHSHDFQALQDQSEKEREASSQLRATKSSLVHERLQSAIAYRYA
ncbi:hypothetical protein BASA61_008653 [Batrachochytrium salamandrivorans]|nr:hypothetical protein BASA61_008653 [Batrachochytrium salamandrivorans]